MKFRTMPDHTVIINATNIGYKFHGLGVYSLNIIKELTKLKTDLNFIVYLNKSCKKHINGINFPQNFKLKWVTSKISPDNKFKGHLLRLIYSNLISLKHFRYLQFNTSQTEINFFRSRQIVTIHDVIPLLFKQHHKKLYYYFKFILKYGLKNANYVLTPSFHSKELIKEIFNLPEERIKAIHNGAAGKINHKYCANSSLKRDRYIIYLGRINKMKNLGTLLAAYANVHKKINMKLVIVSDDSEEFKKDIKSSGIKDEVKEKIIFKCNISDEEKCKLLSNASMLVFPSLYEGFGLPPIEAMACGCPVIASDNSSITEVCGDAAYYIDPLDIQSISNAILKINYDNTLREEFIKKGLQRAANFKWEVSAYNHLSVFENVLAYNCFPVEEKRRTIAVFNRSFSSVSQVE